MALRPMLDDIELQQVQIIESDQDQALAQHRIPRLEGDFFQHLGRHAGSFCLHAVLTGPEARQGVEALEEKFRAGTPVSFVADIATAVQVEQVLIAGFDVRDLAGRPLRFAVSLRLCEYQEPQPPAATEETFGESEATQEEAENAGNERSEEVTDQVSAGQGDLRVEVSLESGGDLSDLGVLVEGTSDTGEAVRFTIEEQTDGVFARQSVPAGNYTVQAFRR